MRDLRPSPQLAERQPVQGGGRNRGFVHKDGGGERIACLPAVRGALRTSGQVHLWVKDTGVTRGPRWCSASNDAACVFLLINRIIAMGQGEAVPWKRQETVFLNLRVSAVTQTGHSNDVQEGEAAPSCGEVGAGTRSANACAAPGTERRPHQRPCP